MQPSIPLAFSVWTAQCPLMLSPRSLSKHQVDLWPHYIPGLYFPIGKTLHLPLLNFMRFLLPTLPVPLSCIIPLFISSCWVTVLSEVSTSPVSLISLTNHQGTVNPIIQITYQDLKQHWAPHRSLRDPTSGRFWFEKELRSSSSPPSGCSLSGRSPPTTEHMSGSYRTTLSRRKLWVNMSKALGKSR